MVTQKHNDRRRKHLQAASVLFWTLKRAGRERNYETAGTKTVGRWVKYEHYRIRPFFWYRWILFRFNEGWVRDSSIL